MKTWLESVERAADGTFPGEWKLLHDQPEGDNVIVALGESGSPPTLIAAFDRVDDAQFLIDARKFMLARGAR